jgi:hypothetical protein
MTASSIYIERRQTHPFTDMFMMLIRIEQSSPQTTPSKMSMRQKASAPGSITRVPSKLRDSSVFENKRSETPASRYSSPEEDGTVRSTPASTAFSMSPEKKGFLPSLASSPAPASPPAKASQVDHDYLGKFASEQVTLIRVADCSVLDVEGEETGSSTDTSDSS